jgi:hypothetical protein
MGNEQDVRRKLLGLVGIGEGSDPDGSAKHDDLIYGPICGDEDEAATDNADCASLITTIDELTEE